MLRKISIIALLALMISANCHGQESGKSNTVKAGDILQDLIPLTALWKNEDTHEFINFIQENTEAMGVPNGVLQNGAKLSAEASLRLTPYTS